MITAILVFTRKKNTPVSTETKTTTQNTVSEIDSDNDGLPDWKEILWKTDPKVSDTDSDGMNDGEELKNNRNPIKPAPGDELTDEEIKSLNDPSNYVSPFDRASKTDDFTQKFLTQYVLQKSLSEGVLDDVAKDVLIKSVLGETSTAMPFRTFSVIDIKISEADNTATIKQYGNSVGEIIIKNNPGMTMENMLKLLKTAVETKNSSGLEQLKTVIEKNTQIINESLKISVPRSAVNIHVDFLNGMSRITEMILGMYKSINDPMFGLVVIGDYQATAVELKNTNTRIEEYFNKKNIVYKSSDYGYVFTNNIF
ncbi:MAG: thrombospondin type 3 repeat-containing protein [Parcubacteria group bacterium Athens0714_16]|nr:MAG: thrombospondin type 3 repeat-containing protein [Parcubacteria group bacterium Athens0714_16]